MIKKKTKFEDIPVTEFCFKYTMHRATYFRAKKRGYFYVKYHIKNVDVSDNFDTELAYKIARAIFKKYFHERLEIKDDLIQEGVLESFVKSGARGTYPHVLSRLICQGMRNYIYKIYGRYGQKKTEVYDESCNAKVKHSAL